ncbi:hypothetical protein [Paenarthrobacter sp. PH39-S1]|uniref:hypothetical protein n=1 Tax=Paenarthrobacter sp. PH39-S1 TaxID=3046204 RepID=UPI0024BAE3CC|nr:hypothetical protein [Paenarthrobacter sp. PH39-S1]MDJ0356590.1 hypothetical protein [Paenarthrobacter sp. PH39-S1]
MAIGNAEQVSDSFDAWLRQTLSQSGVADLRRNLQLIIAAERTDRETIPWNS